MSVFTIDLNNESAAVLLRALSYGQSAISTKEVKTGNAEIINHNIQELRRQICNKLSEQIIDSVLELEN